ncbi:hypothetical protein FRC18_001897 [Serendipita sp. 400]|nr:hypothetical protein FRC18_001897 [Serendipita sp. 400]
MDGPPPPIVNLAAALWGTTSQVSDPVAYAPVVIPSLEATRPHLAIAPCLAQLMPLKLVEVQTLSKSMSRTTTHIQSALLPSSTRTTDTRMRNAGKMTPITFSSGKIPPLRFRPTR